jgi:16S rRNA (cytidine1402-2'-O)-methyltransferase
VAGTLYVVATPIGNLADLSFRAVETLRSVSWIACEDTRQTRKLLAHYGISGRMISYHEHNEEQRSQELIEKLEQGDTVALVTDAGTPLVSDPGFRLVRQAIDHGIQVTPVPGPSAVMAALAAAGLATDSFYFGGFLPRKQGERRKLLEQLSGLDATLVFYEAPHRLRESLADVAAVMGGRPAVIARELTKIHEEFLRGTATALIEELSRRGGVRGEITLLIGKGEAPAYASVCQEDIGEQLRRLEQEGFSRMQAVKEISRRLRLPKREVYRLAGLKD